MFQFSESGCCDWDGGIIGVMSIVDDSGKPIPMIGSTQEVTDHQRTEEQADQLRLELSTLVETVAGVAHEINQPLYAIQNFAEACKATIFSNKQVNQYELLDWIQQISAQAERAGAIIQRLHSFVRRPDRQQTRLDGNENLKETPTKNR